MILHVLSFILISIAVLIICFYLRWKINFKNILHANSHIIETEAGTIEYIKKGSSGPCILFLHGSPGGCDQAPKPFHGFQLLAPSRPGYLSTPLNVGRTPSEQAKSCASLIDALKIEKVIVIGVSGGGPSAISFAAQFPERTLALVVLEAISQPYEYTGRMPIFMKIDMIYWFLLSFVLTLFGPAYFVIKHAANKSIQQKILKSDEKISDIKRFMWSLGPPSLRMTGWNNDMLQFASLSLPVDRIHIPTLIIHGAQDNIVPFTHSLQLANQISGCRFLCIEDADHLMPISHKEVINQHIFNFLNGLSDNA